MLTVCESRSSADLGEEEEEDEALETFFPREVRTGEEAAAEEEQLKSSSYSAAAFDGSEAEPEAEGGGAAPPLIGSKLAPPSLSVLNRLLGPGSVSAISSSVSPSSPLLPSFSRVLPAVAIGGPDEVEGANAVPSSSAFRRDSFCTAICRAVQCARLRSLAYIFEIGTEEKDLPSRRAWFIPITAQTY